MRPGPDYRRRSLICALVALGMAFDGLSRTGIEVPRPRPGATVVGPDRGGGGHRDPFHEAKVALLTTINEERQLLGAPPLAYDPFAARVADEFCLKSATTGSIGHWDTDGRPPYLRWGLAGGVDYQAENFAAETRSGYAYREPMARLLQLAHQRFMAERPPDDGHRKTVLNPIWNHVGIGAAIVGGEFRMTEEYSRRVVEWVEHPKGSQRVGSVVEVTVKLPRGWGVSAVDVSPEPFPVPMSLREIAARGSYHYPPAWKTLRPYPPPGASWTSGEKGSFYAPTGGCVTVKVALDAGPGYYFVVFFGGQGNIFGRELMPIAAPMIRVD